MGVCDGGVRVGWVGAVEGVIIAAAQASMGIASRTGGRAQVNSVLVLAVCPSSGVSRSFGKHTSMYMRQF